MDQQRDLEETFQPVIASNEKMSQDIIKDLAPITEGLEEINRNIEIKKETLRPKIGCKLRLVSDQGRIQTDFAGLVKPVKFHKTHFLGWCKTLGIHQP